MVLKAGDRTCRGIKDRDKMQEGLSDGVRMAAGGRIFYSCQPCADAGLATLKLPQDSINGGFCYIAARLPAGLGGSSAVFDFFKKGPYGFSRKHKIINERRIQQGKSFSTALLLVPVAAKKTVAAFYPYQRALLRIAVKESVQY